MTNKGLRLDDQGKLYTWMTNSAPASLPTQSA
jgi:hypothetical protein